MAPRKRRLTGTGSSLTEKTLTGLSDFGRSLNLSVLLTDSVLQDAYAAAETDGELPTNRARVLILGEPRAGKTSLLNRLLGRDFDSQERPTHGIETRMCHVTNVDKQWNESGGAKADDIRECASAVTILRKASSAERPSEVDVNSSNLHKSQSPTEEPIDSSLSLLQLMKTATQLIFVVVVVFTLGIFQYGYVVFVWCSICVSALLLDYNNSYRFLTSMSLVGILFDAMIRTNQPLLKLSCAADDDGSSVDQELKSAVGNSFFIFVNTILVGLANGLGFRTGIAVAFSASVHPAETALTLESALRGLNTSWNMLLLSGIFGFGGVLGLASLKYCTANDRWHKTRSGLCCALLALPFSLVWRGPCGHRAYWLIFLNGFTMTTGGTWGAIFGRRAVLKYGFEASYVTKKTAGFAFGLYLVHVCGWTLRIPNPCLVSVVFYVLSIAAHPLFDLHTTYKIWRTKSTYPVKVIRKQMKAMIKGQPLLETKLSLWDFAGDPLYHCTHHVFMPDRALYIIVLNLEVAVSDEDAQLQKLLFWLHSVCAHARHPDAVVIIVGTHRDSVSEASVSRFKDRLNQRVSAPFCHRLVMNPADDKPLFLVENSQPLDQDIQRLRAEVFRRVESAEYAQERYPIKYLHFYREIQNRRKLAEVDNAANVLTLEQVHDLARDACNVSGEDELKNMLRFFIEAGEIIHKDDDEELRKYVVLDPQFLVDVMKKLVRIPRASDRSHRYAAEWRNYESSGIIAEGLLRHIYEDMSHLVPLFARLLQTYDLMCPVAPTVDSNGSPKSFLVPAVLPPYRGDSAVFWESTSKEEVFYFDFGCFEPSTVYYRLLTRCLTHACLDIDPNSRPLIFADRCRFHIGASFVFKLQLEKTSSRQMLLSVAVLAFEGGNPASKLLRFLLHVVGNIVARDYPYLGFTFGPRCPFCAPAVQTSEPSETPVIEGCDHDNNNNNNDQTIHVLKMAGHDLCFPTTSPVVMLCGTKRYELNLQLPVSKYPSIRRTCSTPPQRVGFRLETPITKLPPDLFHRVCSLLNNSPGIRDWKTLAGELGKDVGDVAMLSSKRVSNPTEHLLQEWAMTDGGVTVGDLLQVLARPSLQRLDIIADVRAQMTQE